MLPEATLSERVTLGAMELDSRASGWFEKIDLDNLHLASPGRCVLGQLYGDYFAALDELGWDFDDGFAFGLDVHSDEGNYSDMHTLTDLWKTEIGNRRTEVK